MNRPTWVRRITALLLVAALPACSTSRRNVPRTTSYALPHDRTTTLEVLFAKLTGAHPDLSGVDYIPRGRLSREACLLMTDLAEKSLDLQCYICDPDISGHFLPDRLVRAAERGVRVRVLLASACASSSERSLGRGLHDSKSRPAAKAIPGLWRGHLPVSGTGVTSIPTKSWSF